MSSMQSVPSSHSELDLASLEINAKAQAKRQVANLLQRPDQLDKVEQIRKRNARKKASVEAQLKTAVQSQLDGVRTGLNQLHNALKDIQEIKEGLNHINRTYASISSLGDTLKPVREENSTHSQLAAAVENLKHIFSVPETVKRCQEYINDNKLLHAHKCLTDLERSRDDLLYELHKQPTPSPTDKNTVNQYFGQVEQLSKDLGKQLWLVLQRTLMTVRREPTNIVTVLRIIEREEKIDAIMLKRYDQTEFLPPGRPKRWRQKAFSVLEDAVAMRVEGNQMADRTMDKMWLVRHLEVTRQLVLEDLKVARTLCDSCFPPNYDIANKYVEMYHNAISLHLNDVVQQGLEGNEIISLLTWIHEYSSEDMMGHRDLKIDMSEYPPLLDTHVIEQLKDKYLSILSNNMEEWMKNSLLTDTKDWQQDTPPDSDEKGFFFTSLPVILLQMIEQNMQVASTISEALERAAFGVIVNELCKFIPTYSCELQIYREKHLANRNEPKFYVHYVIGNINNCLTLSGLTKKLAAANFSSTDELESKRCNDVATDFEKLGSDLCDNLIDIVMLDLNSHVQDLLTRNWMQTSLAVDTICVTVEDYCQDFTHLKSKYHTGLLDKIQLRVAKEYLKALFGRKISFKNFEERGPAAEKIYKEGVQLEKLFSRLIVKHEGQREPPFRALSGLSEIIKLKDTSMMSLEISGFVNAYPDVKMDQLVNLLMIRGDIGRSDSKAMVEDCLGQDHDQKPKAKKTIFSEL